MKSKIVIVGSSNTDMVVRVDHFPQPGETLLGTDFMTAQGGKGANQAVAVARLGGEATFVCCLGNDAFGQQTLGQLKQEGMDTSHVRLVDGAASGVALIPIDKHGENTIIVASGANALLSEQDIQAAASDICQAGILLMQLESPIAPLIMAAQIAHENGALVVLNPAPFPKDSLPEALTRYVDIIIPNETEAAYMTGVKVTDLDSAGKAMAAIRQTGIPHPIITAGKAGAYTLNEEGHPLLVPSFPVQAVDTVAAGDTFCGAFCVALTKGMPMEESIRVGNKAASIAVTRQGAQPSVPQAWEVF